MVVVVVVVVVFLLLLLGVLYLRKVCTAKYPRKVGALPFYLSWIHGNINPLRFRPLSNLNPPQSWFPSTPNQGFPPGLQFLARRDVHPNKFQFQWLYHLLQHCERKSWLCDIQSKDSDQALDRFLRRSDQTDASQGRIACS